MRDSIKITQFQGEDRREAIVNSFCLDIEQEDSFFDYLAEMGYDVDSDDETIINLFFMWQSNNS